MNVRSTRLRIARHVPRPAAAALTNAGRWRHEARRAPGIIHPRFLLRHMMKILLWIIGIIFVIGLLTTTGILSLVF